MVKSKFPFRLRLLSFQHTFKIFSNGLNLLPMKETVHTPDSPASLAHPQTDTLVLPHNESVLFSYQLQRDSNSFSFHFIWTSEFIPVVGMMEKVKGSWRTKGKKSPDEFCLS